MDDDDGGAPMEGSVGEGATGSQPLGLLLDDDGFVLGQGGDDDDDDIGGGGGGGGFAGSGDGEDDGEDGGSTEAGSELTRWLANQQASLASQQQQQPGAGGGGRARSGFFRFSGTVAARSAQGGPEGAKKEPAKRAKKWVGCTVHANCQALKQASPSLVVGYAQVFVVGPTN